MVVGSGFSIGGLLSFSEVRWDFPELENREKSFRRPFW
jgi:hypothetical protein